MTGGIVDGRYLEVLIRPNHEASETAVGVVLRVAGTMGIAVHTVDVDSDPELREAFSERLPVVRDPVRHHHRRGHDLRSPSGRRFHANVGRFLKGTLMTRWWIAFAVSLLLAGCAGSADSCNTIIDDAANMLIEVTDAFGAGTEDVTFTEDELLEIPDRMAALGCDPQAVSWDAMTSFAADNGLDEEQQGRFIFLLFGLLDGSILD